MESSSFGLKPASRIRSAVAGSCGVIRTKIRRPAFFLVLLLVALPPSLLLLVLDDDDLVLAAPPTTVCCCCGEGVKRDCCSSFRSSCSC